MTNNTDNPIVSMEDVEPELVCATRLRCAMEDVYFAARDAARHTGQPPTPAMAAAVAQRAKDRFLDALEALRMLEEFINNQAAKKP